MTEKRTAELLYGWHQEVREKRKLQRVTHYWLVLAESIEEALAFVIRWHSRRPGQHETLRYLEPSYHCTVSEHRIAGRTEVVVIINQFGSVKLKDYDFTR